MFKKTINFIKYHNAFIVILAIVFLASFSALAASEDLRDKVLGEEIITKEGIDNSLLLSADLESFDLEMKILDIAEDEENYYLDYQFKTYGIQENIWQEVVKKERIEIAKKALKNQDLGLYAAEELGEIIDRELAFLKEVQENEAKKGGTKITQETKYNGLLGMVINTKTKELPPEYEPIIKPPVIDETAPASSGEEDQSFDEIQIQIEETIKKEYPEDSPYYQKLKELCEKNNLFWYNKDCHDDPEIIPACDIENPSLCDTQDLCEEADLFWYDDICNPEEKQQPEEEPAPEEEMTGEESVDDAEGNPAEESADEDMTKEESISDPEEPAEEDDAIVSLKDF